jgi:acyl dehydratase
MKSTRPQLVYFLTIDECKFRKPVVPGDVLEYHVKKLKQRRNIWRFAGEAKVGTRWLPGVVSAMGEPQSQHEQYPSDCHLEGRPDRRRRRHRSLLLIGRM